MICIITIFSSSVIHTLYMHLPPPKKKKKNPPPKTTHPDLDTHYRETEGVSLQQVQWYLLQAGVGGHWAFRKQRGKGWLIITL